MREIRYRCFYRHNMYPVTGMSGNPLTVSMIDSDFGEMSPDLEHIKGVMQFTGFHHNGKDVFESDIIEFELEDGSIEIGVVRFSKEGYWTSQKESEHEEILSEELDYYKDKAKVIGDIYSTPKLVP